MKQEDKELLLKDLCARLPYGVKGLALGEKVDIIMLRLGKYPAVEITTGLDSLYLNVEDIKPYLRPMSSMTEEERKEYAKLLFADLGGVYEDYYKALDYLHSIHVDYRGLIPKGLALEAPENMYKEEQE